MGKNILLVGKARSGKDTVAKIMERDYSYHIYHFGDGIAEIIARYFPTEWAKGKPRTHFQHIGQSLRELDEDVWVKYCLRDILASYTPAVIADGRQVNEAVKLREQGFVIIKVVAGEKVRIDRMEQLGDSFTLDSLHHDTELQVDKIEPDFYLHNHGSMEQLEEQIRKIMGEIWNGR
jgi:dephospho-CoA kinase